MYTACRLPPRPPILKTCVDFELVTAVKDTLVMNGTSYECGWLFWEKGKCFGMIELVAQWGEGGGGRPFRLRGTVCNDTPAKPGKNAALILSNGKGSA